MTFSAKNRERNPTGLWVEANQLYWKRTAAVWGKKKNRMEKFLQFLTRQKKKKKFSLALLSTNRTWVAERKEQRNTFVIVFFSLPPMENFIAVSSDFCIFLSGFYNNDLFTVFLFFLFCHSMAYGVPGPETRSKLQL